MRVDREPRCFLLQDCALSRKIYPQKKQKAKDRWGVNVACFAHTQSPTNSLAPPPLHQKPTKTLHHYSFLHLLSYIMHVSLCYHKWFCFQPQWIVEGSCIICHYQYVLNYAWMILVWVSAYYQRCIRLFDPHIGRQILLLSFHRGIKATRDHGYVVCSDFLWLANECDCVCLPQQNCG